MTIPVYTKRLAGPMAVAQSAQYVVAEVPAGRVWIVKALQAYNPSSTAAITFYIGYLGTVGVGFVLQRFDMAPQSSVFAQLLIPVNAGHKLRVHTAGGLAVNFLMAGYDFADT